MGEVYKAWDTRLRRNVAVKILPESFCADPSRVARFQIEAQSPGALNHPNILTVFDVGTNGHAPYLVGELLEGESLGQRFRNGKLSVARAVDFARQIASGLACRTLKGNRSSRHKTREPFHYERRAHQDSRFWARADNSGSRGDD
jgi:eukaryotic-like serine/threonine-protein kinase